MACGVGTETNPKTIGTAYPNRITLGSMPTVSAVLFDYGLVLSGPPHLPDWERIRTLLGVDEETLQHAYWQPRTDYDRGTLTGEAYWRAVAELAHVPVPEGSLQELFDLDAALWSRPNEAMVAWAKALQRSGMPTGILSNLGDAMETGIRARLGWLDQFSHMTFSHALGIIKPDRAIYEHAARGLGLLPEQILFIDDRADNIAGAHQAGMQAIQYESHAQFERDMETARLGYLLHPTTVSEQTPKSVARP
jgi:putative hydrolase of the HAD superfamily